MALRRFAGFHRQGQGTAQGVLGTLQQAFKRRIVQPAQHQDLTARQQRARQHEGRILRCGPNQNDRAILDKRQEGVLLATIEPMNFVHEQQCAFALLAPLRGFEQAAQISHAGGDG